MSIELIALFIFLLVFIVLTEFRIIKKERDWELERKSYIKSLLDERDLKDLKEKEIRETELYYKNIGLENLRGEKVMEEKIIYEEEELDDYDEAITETQEQIKAYNERMKQNNL